VDPSRYRAIVLLDDALQTLHPGQLATARWSGARVLLCPDRVSARNLGGWIRAGFHGLVDLADLVTHEEAPRHPPLRRWERPRMAPDTWWPRSASATSRAGAALRSATELQRTWSVADWARSLGLSRQALWTLCREDDVIQARPRDVLAAHVECLARIGRSAGVPTWLVARSLGFASASALCHARRRLAMKVPTH
jgi:hypothetical protein